MYTYRFSPKPGKKVDETVKLKIVRDGKETAVDVPVEESPLAGGERGGIRTWFKELQEKLGAPPVGGHGPCGDKPCGDGPCGDGPCGTKPPAGDAPKGVWGAQEELHTQIGELRERLEKTEKQLKELKEKVEKK